MKGNKQILLILSCGGMEFTWRYAWALFLTLLLANRPFPLPAALAVFAMASAVTVAGDHTRWRFYQIPVLHVIGFTTGWLLTAYLLFYESVPVFSFKWINDWLGQLRAPGNWLIQLSVFACLLLFWLGARAMVKRPSTYYPVCLQFDKGLGAFFMLLLVKFTMEFKGGLFLKNPITPYLLVAFIVSSLVAISLSRNQSDAQKSYRPGYHHIGIVLSFMSIVLLFSAVLSLLFLPYLTLMADSAQIILKETTAPLGTVLTNIIRFLFSIGKYRQKMGSQIFSGSDADRLYRDSEIAWAQGLGWFLFGVIGVIALWFFCYLIGWLMRRFLKRKTGDTSGLSTMDLISRILTMIGTVFLGVWNGLLSFLKRVDSAAMVYAGMLRWGRRSGLTAAVSETPIEYGTRLKHRFPQLNSEIEQIIEAFNREIYGQTPLDQAVLSGIQSARRRMRNPRYWPLRIKAWFAVPSRVGGLESNR
jgi:hypothetical protein